MAISSMLSSAGNFINSPSFSNIYNRGASTTLEHSQNGAYLLRSGARVPMTPENRRMDYFWRDAFMTVVTAYFFELCFRAVDAAYKSPKITQALELNELAHRYQTDLRQKYGLSDTDLKKINYTGLDDTLHHRLLKGVKADNFKLVPDLLEHDLEKRLSDPAKLTGDEQLKAIQARQMVSHLRFRLNYMDHLKKEKNLSHDDAKTIVDKVDACFKAIEGQLKKEAGFTEYKSQFQGFYKSIPCEKKLMQFLDDSAKKKALINTILDKELNGFTEKINGLGTRHLIEEGIDSKFTQMALKKIGSSGEWPKLVLSLATNILYFGVVGNWLDFNVIQPWQKKISDERGGVKELIAPAYAAIIPGALTTAALSYVPMISKLGPATRFLVAGTAGMAAYAAASYAFVMGRLQSLRQNGPTQNPAGQAQAAKPFTPPNPSPNGNQPAPDSPFSTMPAATFHPRRGFGNFPPQTMNNGFTQANAFMPMVHNVAQGFGSPRFGASPATELQKRHQQAYSE